uniref:NADH-ubiquinone oxidoreductase chain 2 n=1 Tax=Omphalotus japonicus TaxID=72119 RepID=A0A6M8U7I7_9AGAR|nr:NADH dehydrogenase subunit 2 [Omphalotus japonicus]QKJ84731.1 NADH dehydrogenase subunit 2 [Omphalotus japonicus]
MIFLTLIILLLSALLSFNILLIDIVTGIGIYNGLFHINLISQVIEIFLLFIGSTILISWPIQKEFIIEVINTKYNNNIDSHSIASFSRSASSDSFSSPFSLSSTYGNGTEGKASGDMGANWVGLTILPIILYKFFYKLFYISLFCTLGASLLISCSDLISMYLSIELQSFSLYVLSTLYKDSELSTNAGLKYFLLGGLSSCLILFGAGLIYAYTGITNFESIYSLLSVFSLEINDNLVQIFFFFLAREYNGSIFLGIIFIFVGFLFKISAAPFHNWSPDVYDDSPTIVTIWLTIIPKISILILLLELHIHIDLIDQLSLFGNLNLFNFNIDTITKNLLLITSLLSLIIGSVVGLAQNRIKRLLAYSTISHIGFILLALGINTEQSIDSFIFYIIQYIITNLNIFLIIIGLSYMINQSINKDQNTSIKDIRYISEFKGQFYLNPLIILSFTICLFSMAGIPPLIGFFSKQFVLYSAVQNGYNFISFIAIFVSVISASYYLKIIKTFFISTGAKARVAVSSALAKAAARENNSLEKLSNIHSFLISTLTLSILLFIFKPSLILNITQLLSLSLFYI